MATNVKPKELNYDHYKTEKYDQDIIKSIPGHEELHKVVDKIIERFDKKSLKILELGVGTGLTAERVLKIIPAAEYTAIDFSETMLNGARKRLAKYNVAFIQGDYSQIALPCNNNLVISVISIHHQKTNEDKKRLFQRIYSSLSKEGAFIFGDLVTHKDQQVAALNDAKHFHHLAENAQDERSLAEWAHHHKYLNSLAPLEDQIEWLKEVGFKEVQVVFTKYNTALIYAAK